MLSCRLPAFPVCQCKQEQALSLLGTIANIQSRLPALEDPAAYGTLAALPGAAALQQRLLGKQLAALDELIVQLQQGLEDMQVRPGQVQPARHPRPHISPREVLLLPVSFSCYGSLHAARPSRSPASQAAVGGMERQAQQAQRLVQQDRSLTPAVCSASAGPIPSVNQCVAGLRDIWCERQGARGQAPAPC